MLPTLKNVDHQTECLISGYLRELYELLSKYDDKYIFINIPPLVTVTIMSFHFVDEVFEILGIYTQVFNQGKTIQKTNGHRENTSYGRVVIPSLSKVICEWDIKVNHLSDQGFRIGICSDFTLTEKCFVDDDFSSNYALECVNGYKVSKGQRASHSSRYHEHDIVTIKLNLKKRCVDFLINKNSSEKGIAFENIYVGEDISYRLAISMYGNGDGVTIEKFQYSLES